MTDISKCNGAGCELKEKCYRFTALDNEYRQSYMTPDKRGLECEYFWHITNEGRKYEFTICDEVDHE